MIAAAQGHRGRNKQSVDALQCLKAASIVVPPAPAQPVPAAVQAVDKFLLQATSRYSRPHVPLADSVRCAAGLALPPWREMCRGMQAASYRRGVIFPPGSPVPTPDLMAYYALLPSLAPPLRHETIIDRGRRCPAARPAGGYRHGQTCRWTRLGTICSPIVTK